MLMTIEGVFMGACEKSRTRDGQIETSVSVDVYQPNSTASNKTLSVKILDGSNLAKILEKYKMGVPVKFQATANAFNSNIYVSHVSGLI